MLSRVRWSVRIGVRLSQSDRRKSLTRSPPYSACDFTWCSTCSPNHTLGRIVDDGRQVGGRLNGSRAWTYPSPPSLIGSSPMTSAIVKRRRNCGMGSRTKDSPGSNSSPFSG